LGHHKTFAENEKIPTEYINYWRDYRKYDTYAEIVAAVSGFGASDMFKRYLCVADGYEYYWNGTDLVRIPSATGGGGSAAKGNYSYLIYKSGSDYYAEDSDGNVVYGGSGDAGGVDGADASAVIQAVIDAEPTGIIFLKGGTYDVSNASLKLQNDTAYHFRGEGKAFTILNAGNAADAKVFEIVDSGNYPNHNKKHQIEDLCMCAYNGYGIHCDFANHAQNSLQVTPRFTLSHLRFGKAEDGLYCKYGMKINGIYKPVINDIEIHGYAADSIGIWLLTTNTGSLACGDGSFVAVRIELWGTDGTGILFDATGSATSAVNLLNFYDYECLGSSTATGLYFKANDKTKGHLQMMYFYGFRLEYIGTGIKLEGSPTSTSVQTIKNIVFDAGDVGCQTLNVNGIGTFAYFGTGITFRNCNFYQSDIDLSNMLASPAASGRFHFDKCYNGESIVLGSADVDLYFHDCVGGLYVKDTVLYSSGKSTGTGAEQTIAHALTLTGDAIAPDRVILTPNDDGVATLYESTAADTTNIYVTATNAKAYTWQAFVDSEEIHIAR